MAEKPQIINIGRADSPAPPKLNVSTKLDRGTLKLVSSPAASSKPKSVNFGPGVEMLMNSKISLSPHIGAATLEAQDRIGIELAEKIIEILK